MPLSPRFSVSARKAQDLTYVNFELIIMAGKLVLACSMEDSHTGAAPVKLWEGQRVRVKKLECCNITVLTSALDFYMMSSSTLRRPTL